MNEQTNGPVFPPLSANQYNSLARWAHLEIRGHPAYRTWSGSQRAEAEQRRLQEMMVSPHYLNLVGYRPEVQAAAPSTSGGAMVVQEPHQETPEKKEESRRRTIDHKRLIGLSAAEIARQLIEAGLVTEDTQPGRGLEIVGTSHRHERKRDAVVPQTELERMG
jgi:hypothetical protein